jgi:hypothetical protein
VQTDSRPLPAIPTPPTPATMTPPLLDHDTEDL